jgi:hypothetical protein
MIIGQICAYVVMLSGILLVAGCALMNYEPRDGAQSDSGLEGQSKTLAGSYKDVGSNGSIKPHPESSDKEPQSRTTGAIILGGPAEIPDMTTLTIKKTGKPGGTKAGSGSGPNSKDSSNGAMGADGQ